MKFFHIINPYQAPEDSEEKATQDKTIESLVNAYEYAREFVDVKLVMKVDPEEADYFRLRFDYDFVEFSEIKLTSDMLGQNFNVERKLPVLSDLVDLTEIEKSGGCNIDEDFVVFTNMDICVQPFFYTELAKNICAGFDCFVVNRRTVDKSLLYKSLLESYASDGAKHIGHDCFVLPMRQLKEFYLKDHILGIGFVFRPFLLNCILNSNNFKEFDDAYLTFHFGDDMEWKSDKYSDYLEHNRNMLIQVYEGLIDQINEIDETKKEWIRKFFSFDFLKNVGSDA